MPDRARLLRSELTGHETRWPETRMSHQVLQERTPFCRRGRGKETRWRRRSTRV